MELGGDEKRIRALFSEFSCEDHNITPRFEPLWQRAAAPAQPRHPGPSIAILASVLIGLTFGMASWLNYKSVQSAAEINAVNITPLIIPAPNPGPTIIERSSHHPRKPARRSQPGRSVTTEAALLSSWQSPTAKFLSSPTNSGFSSLPQLNQSVEDLKSFLPKNNEMLKESNQ